MLLGLTRGEAVLTLLVFALVYGGVALPRLGERLGVFLVKRQSSNHPPDGGGNLETKRQG